MTRYYKATVEETIRVLKRVQFEVPDDMELTDEQLRSIGRAKVYERGIEQGDHGWIIIDSDDVVINVQPLCRLEDLRPGMGILMHERYRGVVIEVQTHGPCIGFSADWQDMELNGRFIPCRMWIQGRPANVIEDPEGPWATPRTFRCRNKHCYWSHDHLGPFRGVTALPYCPNCHQQIVEIV